MKIKEEINLEILLDYGFEKIEENDDEYVISSYDYKFAIGHSRRGQYYYLLVSEQTRELMIYATEPDGSGGTTKFPDILLNLFQDGLVTNL